MQHRSFFAAAAIALATASCKMEEPSSEKAAKATRAAAPVEPAAPKAAARPTEPIGPRGVRFLKAEEGDAAALVKKHMDEARQQNREIVVYEGATWCEPCRRFHDAAGRGELDATFPNLTLVEFDADHDGERLVEAGYASRFIPLFAVPAPDGKASGKQIEGSIKGSDAAAEITPRLRALLGR